MNTPAHMIINLALLNRRKGSAPAMPIVLGAVIPDAMMFVFYFVQKAILAKPETIIWREAYFDPTWQLVFDVFNSLPLVLVGLIIALKKKMLWWKFLFLSMLLHILGDLPLHHDDAHRHFIPISNWRFFSPLSYWDPQYHGNIISVLEFISVILCSVLLLKYNASTGTRKLVGTILFVYFAYGIYVVTVWIS